MAERTVAGAPVGDSATAGPAWRVRHRKSASDRCNYGVNERASPPKTIGGAVASPGTWKVYGSPDVVPADEAPRPAVSASQPTTTAAGPPFRPNPRQRHDRRHRMVQRAPVTPVVPGF
jgi:hypothetical protein